MANPLILFAHGAGAPSSSQWMKAWAERLSSLGKVVPFDYPYMQRGRRTPDPLPKLVEAHRAALNDARREHVGPVVLAGKSMGSRVGCHLALEETVDGLICFGYPLKAPGGKVRDEVLLSSKTPILFVQGTRDSLCPLSLLDEVRSKMNARNELYVVKGANHSLEVSKTELSSAGQTQVDVDQCVFEAVRNFVQGLAGA